jgi:hypothetical protein
MIEFMRCRKQWREGFRDRYEPMLGQRKVGETRQMGNRMFIQCAHCVVSCSRIVRASRLNQLGTPGWRSEYPAVEFRSPGACHLAPQIRTEGAA